VSTFAATTCSIVSRPGAVRVNAVARGSTAWISVVPPSGGAIATQSPTAGKSAASRASWRRRPLDSARRGSASGAISTW
jgi:hypothetical protein